MPVARLDAYLTMWTSWLMTSALDATGSAGLEARHSLENVGCAKQARHLAPRARRVLYARLVGQLDVPLRFVQWKLVAAV